MGEIRSAIVNYTQAGQSLGTATVTFKHSADAEKAVTDYDQAEVDGKPMYIKLIGTVSQAPVVVKKKKPTVTQAPSHANGAAAMPPSPAFDPSILAAAPPAFNPLAFAGAFNPAAVGRAPFNPRPAGPRRGSSSSSSSAAPRGRGAPRGASRGASRGGRGGRGGRGERAPSQADLDAELDSYHTPSATA